MNFWRKEDLDIAGVIQVGITDRKTNSFDCKVESRSDERDRKKESRIGVKKAVLSRIIGNN